MSGIFEQKKNMGGIMMQGLAWKHVKHFKKYSKTFKYNLEGFRIFHKILVILQVSKTI